MNENAASNAAPRAMNIARRTSASRIPNVSTRCWCSAGTANVPMMITNTKRLSTDRLFSTTYPAKYWPPNSQPAIRQYVLVLSR